MWSATVHLQEVSNHRFPWLMFLDGHLDSVFDHRVEPLAAPIIHTQRGTMVMNISSFQKNRENSRHKLNTVISNYRLLNGFPWWLKNDDRNKTTESEVAA